MAKNAPIAAVTATLNLTDGLTLQMSEAGNKVLNPPAPLPTPTFAGVTTPPAPSYTVPKAAKP